MLDHDAFENVGHVFATVRRVLEEIQRLLPLDHDNRVALVVEQPAERLLVDAVGLVLEPVDLDRVGDEAFVLLERPEGEAHLFGRRRNNVRELARAEADRIKTIQPHNGCAGID